MLKIERCCDIHDLVKEVSKVSGKSITEVSGNMIAMNLHPMSDYSETFITFKNGARCCPSIPWLDNAIYDVLKEVGCESITVVDNG